MGKTQITLAIVAYLGRTAANYPNRNLQSGYNFTIYQGGDSF